MENRLQALINEDLVNYESPKSGQGYDWHNKMNPVQMTIVDVLNKHSGVDQEGRTAKNLPQPIQTVIERILEQSDGNVNLISSFAQAYGNPIIQEDENAKAAMKEIVKTLNQIQKLYEKIAINTEKLKY